MKRIGSIVIMILLLCAAVATGVQAAERPVVDVVFCLDTTGSMGGLIEGAKVKIWSIANQIVTGTPTPKLRIGLVAYRDRGDDYITRIYPLGDDLDRVYENLMSFYADGGGDTPEHVNRALHDALHRIKWSEEADLKIIFLVGDAPPHMDYRDGYDWRAICREAVLMDVIINTVQCGNAPETEQVWQKIARAAEGSYARVPQSGGMSSVRTPLDDDLAELGVRLEETVVAYGDSESISDMKERTGKVKKMAAPAAAERAAYRSKDMGAGTHDLVDAVRFGNVKLEEIEEKELPEEMHAMSTEEREQYLWQKERERELLRIKIEKLSKQRNEYILSLLKKTGSTDSFDEAVKSIIRKQAAEKGIDY